MVQRRIMLENIFILMHRKKNRIEGSIEIKDLFVRFS